MTKAELIELAERCERAEGADNVLNRAIARAIGWGYQTPSQARRKNPAWFHPDDCRNGEPVFDSLHGTDVWREPMPYVFSIDAALTLVPEGLAWTLGQNVHHRHWQASVNSIGEDGEPVSLGFGGSGVIKSTPALALCAAALRARASMMGDDA